MSLVYIKNGSYTEQVSLTTSSSNGETITFEGYNASRGDAPLDNTRPVIDGESTRLVHGGSIWGNITKHLRFTGSTGQGTSATNHTFMYCRFNNNSTSGTAAGNNDYFHCEMDNNSDTGSDGNGRYYFCELHDNTNEGYESTNSSHTPQFYGSLFYDNASHGIDHIGDSHVLVGNTIDGNTGASSDGVIWTEASIAVRWFVMVNNSSSNNGRYGFNRDATTSRQPAVFEYNAYYGNATNLNNLTAGPNDVTGDPLYTDAAGEDFSLQSTSPLIDAGAPGVFPHAVTTGYTDIGAFQEQTGGGGGTNATGAVSIAY
jgi:hypothetical protein